MPVIENKLASAILGAIRSRKRESDRHLSAGDASAVPPAKLREATFSDFEGVMALRRIAGWAPDSLENWDRLWRFNPALARMSSAPPMGWVLEAQGKVVGYIGNIALTYRYGDRTLNAVVGSSLVAEPAYRAVSISLNAAFFRQKSVDLYLTTSAIEVVGKIACAFKSVPLPQPEYGSTLFWVLQPGAFAEVVMKKLHLRPPISRIGSVFGSLAVRADRFLRRRRPLGEGTTLAIQDMGVGEIGDEFETFWIEKLKEGPRLLADRSPATLRWHFEFPGDQGSARVLCCRKNGELLGYAVVRHEEPGLETGLRRSIIADMLAKGDDPTVLRSLWIAAYEQAKQAGSHVFEVLGFPPRVRQICSDWHPYVRSYSACPFFYKAADETLQKTFSDERVWYASPFDGDTTLWGFGTAC